MDESTKELVALNQFVTFLVGSGNFGGKRDSDLLVKLASAESTILNVKSWQSLHDYPAFTDFPESSVKEVLLKPNTAIGFSGGGSRAYICALGYLAGLNELDLIKNIRYIG